MCSCLLTNLMCKGDTEKQMAWGLSSKQGNPDLSFLDRLLQLLFPGQLRNAFSIQRVRGLSQGLLSFRHVHNASLGMCLGAITPP